MTKVIHCNSLVRINKACLKILIIYLLTCFSVRMKSFMDEELFSEWQNVYMIVTPSTQIPGILCLNCSNSLYYFTWEPIQTGMYVCNPLYCKSIIYLHQLSHICKAINGIGQCYLQFRFKDDKQFPLLNFTRYGNLSVNHLFNFLCENNQAFYADKNYDGMIQVSTKSNLYLNYERNDYLSYFTYIDNINYWILLNELGFNDPKMCGMDYIIRFSEDGVIDINEAEFKEIKNDFLLNGIDDKNRCIFWPYLTGMYPFNSTEEMRRNIDQNNLNSFRWILNIKNNLIKTQKKIIDEKKKVIKDMILKENYGVEINRILFNVVKAYLMLTRGNCDNEIFKILIILMNAIFILPTNSNNVVTKNNIVMTYEEASSFLFFIFLGLMKKNNYSGVLSSPGKDVTKLVFKIIMHICKTIGNRMKLYSDCANMSDFISNNINDFKKCLGKENLKKYIDSVLSSSDEQFFSCFFVASLIIIKNIPYLNNYGYLENPNLDLSQIMKVANNMSLKYMKEKGIYSFSEKNRKYIDYNPVFLKIC